MMQYICYKKRMTRILVIGLLVAMLVGVTGCSSKKQNDEAASNTIFAMDTSMTITCYGPHAQEGLADSIKEINRLDKMLSVGNPDSEICQINKNGSGIVSEETAIMFEEALALYENTNGAFDITIFPLMNLWGFTDKEITNETFNVPEKTEVEALLKYVDASKLKWNREKREMIIGDHQGVDLGGIAKGFTSSRLMDVMKDAGVESGIVSLGGNVQCLGSKMDGSDWNCAVTNPRDPENTSKFLAVLHVKNKAIITSGGYERYFEDPKTGEIYQHILDPKTGYPVKTDLISATIVSENGMLADGLSTSCYVMGLEKSIEYWKTHSAEFDMILMNDDDQVFVTEGLKGSIDSDFKLTFVEK